MINLEEFWKDCKEELSISIQAISYEVWIEKLEPVCFVDGAIVLATISATAKKTIDSKYLDTIREVATAINPSIKDVIIITNDKREEYLKNQTDFVENAGFVVTAPLPVQKKRNPFLQKYTFDTFVEGKSNSLALAACKTVADEPGTKFNPLFIYSGVGLGKTHLLHAIGNQIYKKNRAANVLYVSADDLVNEIIQVIRNGSNEDNNRFREKYRSCDVLMIDDIQAINGKEATQNAFFNIFNDLYQAQKQIILTSDRAPKEMEKLADRLSTRFSWGLTVDIQAPDMETRVAILKNKAAQSNFALSDEVAEFIAENSTSNIREMEGLLNKIIFFSSLSNTHINTKELAHDALADFIEDKKETIDASDVIDTVCKYFKLSTSDLFSKKKTKNVVEPRMIAIYLITELLDIPLVQIGEMFGGRDHTTIIHARDKISEDIKRNPRIKIIVYDLKNMLLKR